jgi:hypothetical protein
VRLMSAASHPAIDFRRLPSPVDEVAVGDGARVIERARERDGILPAATAGGGVQVEDSFDWEAACRVVEEVPLSVVEEVPLSVPFEPRGRLGRGPKVRRMTSSLGGEGSWRFMEATAMRMNNPVWRGWAAAATVGVVFSTAVCGLVWSLGWRPAMFARSRGAESRLAVAGGPASPSAKATRSGADGGAPSVVGGIEAVDRVALHNEARRALETLLRAATSGEQMPYLTRAEDAGGFGRDTHATRTTPLFTELSALTGRYRTGFKVETQESPDGILVIFDHTPDGPKTDGALFIEQQARRFEQFLAAGEGPPGRLYVALQLAHSFEKDAPRADQFFCLKVQAPLGEGGAVRAYVESNRPEGLLLSRRLRWGKTQRAIVELAWSRPDPQSQSGTPAEPRTALRTDAQAGAHEAESLPPFLRVSNVFSGDW